MASRRAGAWSGRALLLRLFRGSFVAPNTRNYGTRQESKPWKQKPNRKARLAIILTEDVSNLGSKGHIVNVKHGYARNYLLPRNMAVYATPDNIKLHNAKEVAKATRSAVDPVNFFSEFLSSKVLTIRREPETKWGVFEQDIATTMLKQYQVHVPLDRIELADPIESFGESTVDVRLDESTTVTVPVKVVPLVPKQPKKPEDKIGLQKQELTL